MDIIEIQNLEVSFAGKSLLANINLNIQQGEIFLLFGENGSGKSTLIKSILGLVDYSNGKIKIDGKNNSQKVVAENISYLPQYYKFERDFPISVEEVIALECEEDCDISMHNHLQFLNTKSLENKSLLNLSGGELQRVLIAKALVKNPKILILDEPTNNLDEVSKEKLIQLIQKINQENNTTVILISHDFNIIDRIHTENVRIGLLADGHLDEFKDVNSFYKEYRIVRHEHH